jgi:Fur family peroxide stress response transcriptional regulator
MVIITKMKKSFKHSKKRDAILLVLRSTRCHPTAAWVHGRLKECLPGVSLGTVYRNLAALRQMGLARSVGIVEGEERFDGFAEPHPHGICVECGAVFDIPHEGAELGEAWMNLVEPDHFRIDLRQTVFYGVCGGCQKLEHLD